MSTSDLVNDREDWAYLVKIAMPESAGTGPDKVRMILVQMCRHTNAAGHAWVSQQTIADKIAGVYRRDVRNAQEILEASGRIQQDGTVGRAKRYRILAPDVVARLADQLADQLADGLADGLADISATNRTEQKRTPLTPRTDRPEPAPLPTQRAGEESSAADPGKASGQPETLTAAQDKERQRCMDVMRTYHSDRNINPVRADRLAVMAVLDPKTKVSPSRRLKMPLYMDELEERLNHEERAERGRQLADGGRCAEHEAGYALNCPGCRADLACKDRLPGYMGRIQPRCSDTSCGAPVDGDHGQTECRIHERKVS